MDEGILIPLIVVPILFVALPWLILHYVTKWKAHASLTAEDENLLDELYELARRLDDRMVSIERIIQADNPGWQNFAPEPVRPSLDKAARSELRAVLEGREREARLEAPPRRSNQPDLEPRSGGR